MGGIGESNDILGQESWKLGPSLKLLFLLVLFSGSVTTLKNVLFCMTVTVLVWRRFVQGSVYQKKAVAFLTYGKASPDLQHGRRWMFLPVVFWR